MQVRNLTPHTIHFIPREGEGFEIPYALSEGVARVSMETRSVSMEGLPVPAVVQVPGEVTGLPDPVEGVVFIVSAMVAMAVMRPDVCHPADFVRDEDGKIIGARALSFPALV